MSRSIARRTFVAAATAAAVAATAGACSGVAGGGGGDSSSGKSPISLLMVDQDSTKELQSTLIPKFEKDTGIKVNVELVPESGLDAKLSVALSSSQAQYDVVMTGANNWSTLVSSGWLQPLDDRLTDSKVTPDSYLSGFPQQLLETIKSEGKSYAMPYQVGADLLFYNKDMFSKAGLDPAQPPKTMSDLLATAKKLTTPDRSQAGFVGRGSREGNANSFLWLMMWFLNGGRWEGADGKPKYDDVLNQSSAVAATQQYQQLLRDYGPKGIGNYGFAEAQLAMQQGKAAMWLDAAQLGPALDDPSKSKIAGKVGYAAMTGEGDDYIVGAVWAFSLVKNSTHQDEAWKLVQYLTGKDVGVAQATSGTNGSPARTDVLDDEAVKKALNPEFVAALKDAIAHTNPRYTPLIPQGTQIRGAMALQLSKVLAGQATPQAAMDSANAEVKKILK